MLSNFLILFLNLFMFIFHDYVIFLNIIYICIILVENQLLVLDHSIKQIKIK